MSLFMNGNNHCFSVLSSDLAEARVAAKEPALPGEGVADVVLTSRPGQGLRLSGNIYLYDNGQGYVTILAARPGEDGRRWWCPVRHRWQAPVSLDSSPKLELLRDMAHRPGLRPGDLTEVEGPPSPGNSGEMEVREGQLHVYWAVAEGWNKLYRIPPILVRMMLKL